MSNNDGRKTPNTTEGIHIRGLIEHGELDPSIARLVVQVWPLPPEVVPALYEHARQAISTWLRDNKLASGECTDLTAQGPIQ
jgi:hypothetical protein